MINRIAFFFLNRVVIVLLLHDVCGKCDEFVHILIKYSSEVVGFGGGGEFVLRVFILAFDHRS